MRDQMLVKSNSLWRTFALGQEILNWPNVVHGLSNLSHNQLTNQRPTELTNDGTALHRIIPGLITFLSWPNL